MDWVKKAIHEKKIATVGGLLQIAVIDQKGRRYLQYKTTSEESTSDKFELELLIEDGHFVQHNVRTDKKLKLKSASEVYKMSDYSNVELFDDLQ